MTWTEADFDGLSWHDCHVWGIELRAAPVVTGKQCLSLRERNRLTSR